MAQRLVRPLTAWSSSLSSSWTCPACSRATPRLVTPPAQRRRLHHVAELAYDATFAREGIPGLMSATGYELAWTTYQKMIVSKLNDLVAGEHYENVRPKDLVLQFARDPMAASLFNHASMAHNNHFFFTTLSTSPQDLSHSPALRDSLLHTFGSIDTLRTTFLETAASMFGPGFVWLVWARAPPGSSGPGILPGGPRGGRAPGSWKILSTYLAGTPYPEAGYRQQGIDMATSTASSFAAYQAGQTTSLQQPPQQPQQQQQQHTVPTNSVGLFGNHSASARASARLPPGGTTVMPVLCVNTWEHVYIYDYGLAGKREFLQQWWDRVDWGVVEANVPPEVGLALRNPSGFDG